jgi:hypothetical protein
MVVDLLLEIFRSISAQTREWERTSIQKTYQLCRFLSGDIGFYCATSANHLPGSIAPDFQD